MATMHVRQPDNFITARFPNPKTGRLTPSNVSILTHHTPETLEEALALSTTNSPPHHRNHIPHSRPETPWNSRSKDWWMEIRSSPSSTSKTPRSRKTSFATIITDATADHPAFESDAFAIQMPTTREPILSPTCEFRAKLPSPSPAQVEAYQRYAEKARRNASREYKKEHVPTKVVSYDYAYENAYENPGYLELDASPPSSPPMVSTGAFPVSPPIQQNPFGFRSVSAPYQQSISRKPVGQGLSDTSAGAKAETDPFPSFSTSPPKAKDEKIKVKIRPKAHSVIDEDKPQKESWWWLYNRSATSSPCSSPTKPVFAQQSKSTPSSPTKATPQTKSMPSSPSKAPQTKSPSRHKTLSSRLAWLRPAGPRVHKPSPSHSSVTTATPAMASAAATYIDPFTIASNSTTIPTTSRASSPKKAARPRSPPRSKSTTFEDGFAQVKKVALWIVKLCLLVYVLVGLYYLLDAVREAVLVIGAPVRVIKLLLRYVWVCVVWVLKAAVRGWEKWGVKVSLGDGV